MSEHIASQTHCNKLEKIMSNDEFIGKSRPYLRQYFILSSRISHDCGCGKCWLLRHVCECSKTVCADCNQVFEQLM